MFTLEQIQQAHAKVKSGADFPFYIREIKALGVIHYETHVSDGCCYYFGDNAYQINSPAKYNTQPIAQACDQAAFKAGLKEHQAGKSDYATFISMAAENGIDKWVVDLEKKTCTYFDLAGHEILVEQIPE